MPIDVRLAAPQEVRPLRDLSRQEMRCLLLLDS
jgi:hypothetical protein